MKNKSDYRMVKKVRQTETIQQSNKMGCTIVSGSIFPSPPIKVSHYCPAYKYFPIDSLSTEIEKKEKHSKVFSTSTTQ